MSTTIYVVDTSSGSPIDNAVISCGGCTVSSSGGGFYSVDVDLTPVSGGFGVSAPGYVPTLVSWWTTAFSGGSVGLSPVKSLVTAGGPLDNQGDTSDTGSKWGG